MTDNQYHAKEWLNRTYDRAQELETLYKTREAILADMGGVANYAPEFPARNPEAAQNKLARYSMVCAKIEKLEKELKAEHEKTRKICEKLPKSKYRTLLILRYTDYMSWQRIAKIINYSEARTYELHREALELVYKFVPKTKY